MRLDDYIHHVASQTAQKLAFEFTYNGRRYCTIDGDQRYGKPAIIHHVSQILKRCLKVEDFKYFDEKNMLEDLSDRLVGDLKKNERSFDVVRDIGIQTSGLCKLYWAACKTSNAGLATLGFGLLFSLGASNAPPMFQKSTPMLFFTKPPNRKDVIEVVEEAIAWKYGDAVLNIELKPKVVESDQKEDTEIVPEGAFDLYGTLSTVSPQSRKVLLQIGKYNFDELKRAFDAAIHDKKLSPTDKEDILILLGSALARVPGK